MIERFQGAKTFVEESVEEVTKVNWPDQDQLRNATLVIILFVFLVSGIIWLMDVVVRNVVDLILRVFAG